MDARELTLLGYTVAGCSWLVLCKWYANCEYPRYTSFGSQFVGRAHEALPTAAADKTLLTAPARCDQVVFLPTFTDILLEYDPTFSRCLKSALPDDFHRGPSETKGLSFGCFNTAL